MKVGILTFHSQLNYGGVLQCWALQTALERLGHEVVVVDRRLDDWREIHATVYDRMGFRQWTKCGIRSLLGLGDLKPWLRVRRTKAFLRQRLHLTPYHFVDWKAAPQDLGIDLLVVGSDQVWHCGDWGDPRAYLLDGAPAIRSIAYAASFGMTEIPECLDKTHPEVSALPSYKSGLAKFQALSCRESEGVELCRKLGFGSSHVVDPTLLVDADKWHELVSADKTLQLKKGNRRLVCYFLSENLDKARPVLGGFAEQNHCDVEVFANPRSFSPLPFPSSPEKAKRCMKGLQAQWFGRVNVRADSGPIEFVSAFSSADWVVSDSFHALMFSLIFNKNVRLIKPTQENRRKMFARMEEFVSHMNGPVVEDSLDSALQSLRVGEVVSYDADWLERRKAESFAFLRQNLAFT